MKYKIGDAVSTVYGDNGTITDCLSSSLRAIPMYEITKKNGGLVYLEEGDLSPADTSKYEFTFDFADNVVVVIMYRVRDNGQREYIGRGHGHLIHDGTLGYAQAASYALKRIYEDLANGGNN